MSRSSTLAVLYALLAALALLLLAPTMPPFQNADEPAHTYRADQISHFGLIAKRLPNGQVGGMTESGLAVIAARTAAIPFHQDAKLSPAMLAPIPWGVPAPAGFPNTAIYPPIFYLPAATMALAARHLGIDLPAGLVLMRIATGIATIVITSCAIALSGNAAIWLFTIMLLPMSLALTASVSQDGPMLACLAMVAALAAHLRHPAARHPRTAFAMICVLLALSAAARPPYLAFSLLLWTVPVRSKWRLIGLTAIILTTTAWIAIVATNDLLVGAWDPEISPVRQFIGLAVHPWRFPMLIGATIRAFGTPLSRGFIGVLGWLDVGLPRPYYGLAWLILALAAWATWLTGCGKISPRTMALTALAAFGAASGIALVEYLTWTVVGAPVIIGLQGRYFLPCALVLSAGLIRELPSASAMPTRLTALLVAFPVISIAVTLHAVLLRYYG
jgi:uncharacterized membrane protein